MSLKISQGTVPGRISDLGTGQSMGNQHSQFGSQQSIDLSQVDDKKLQREASERLANLPKRKISAEQEIADLQESLRQLNARLTGNNQRVSDAEGQVKEIKTVIARREKALGQLERIESQDQDLKRRINLAYSEVHGLQQDLVDAEKLVTRMKAIRDVDKQRLDQFDHARLAELRKNQKAIDEAFEDLKDPSEQMPLPRR